MKLSELNDWLGVISNLRVVAGLVSVAYEIRLAKSRNEILETYNFDTRVKQIGA